MTKTHTTGSDIDPALLQQIREAQALREQLQGQQHTDTEIRRLVSELGARRIAGRPYGIESSDAIVPGAWHDIPVRIYRRSATAEPRRLMLYFHGGGWTTGSIETHDALCAHIAHRCDHIVISVGYRLAPEHPFPAQNDDAIAATLWALQNRREFGITASAGWTMAGDSAGAHLAIASTLQLQEHHFPVCDSLLLFYPPIAPVVSTESRDRYRSGPGLTVNTMEEFWHYYAGSPAEGAVDRPTGNHHRKGSDSFSDPRLDLRRWPGLNKLPPCVIMTAEHDILRDEGEFFARLLKEHGNDVQCLRAAGMPHGFARMLNASARARDHVDAACARFLALEPLTRGKRTLFE